MTKEQLYKKFFKLGSHIDNLCFHHIEFDLVDDAIHDLWSIVRRDNVSDFNKFAQKFYKIIAVINERCVDCCKKINSTEFKDTKLLVRLEIKHKLNQLQSAHLNLAKFEQEFLAVFGVSLLELNNNLNLKEQPQMKK